MTNNLMYRHYFLFLFSVMTFCMAYGQSDKNSCKCPETKFAETKADTIFTLSNEKAIALCGYRNTDTKSVSFSEFVLTVCGEDSIINFREAVLTCEIRTDQDTLLVDLIKNLPVGKHFAYRKTVWTTEKFYFKENKIMRKIELNRNIRKYTDKEIQLILKKYETGKFSMNKDKIELADRLFVAAVSGNATATKYFQKLPNQFVIFDGADAENYEDLREMLSIWEHPEK